MENDFPEKSNLNGLPEATTTERSRRFYPKVKINRETLPLKITMFLFYGGYKAKLFKAQFFFIVAMSAILPYLTIHMQFLGISMTEVAVIYAVLPFTSFVGPGLLGALADRLGNYKWILIGATLGNAIFHTALLFVPVYREPILHHVPVHVMWDTNLKKGLLLPQDAFWNILGGSSFEFLDKNISLYECHLGSRNDTVCDKPEDGDSLAYHRTNCIHFGIEDYEIVTVHNINVAGQLLCKVNTNILKHGTGNNQVTFWIYFLLRVFASMLVCSCFTLLDATTLAVVKRCGKAEYGKERMWSILGSAIVSPIAGVLVDRFSISSTITDYSAAFYLCDTLLGVSILTFFFIELQVDKPEKGVLKNARKFLQYPEVVIFLIMIFLLGNLWGFVESYLFIFLKELEAPNYLLGLTLTVGSLVGIPFLWGSERIVAQFGRVNLILVAFFTYFVRFFGYSYLTDPFWCFPFEAMEAVTVHLMWASAATYCSVLAPRGLLASLMGIMGALHYSLGKGVGSFLGGLTYGKLGARFAFRYFGIGAGILGILFYMLDFFWIRQVVAKRISENIEKEEKHEGRIGRKGSVFDSNPLAGMSSVISLYEDGEVAENMLNTCEPS